MDWDAAAAFTEEAVAAVFDTTACILKPMTAPAGGRDLNARSVADAGRAEFSFLATLDLEPSQDSQPRHLTLDPGTDGKQVAYDAVISAQTDAWPYQPRRGDRIEVGGRLMQIVLDRSDGTPRKAFYGNWVK